MEMIICICSHVLVPRTGALSPRMPLHQASISPNCYLPCSYTSPDLFHQTQDPGFDSWSGLKIPILLANFAPGLANFDQTKDPGSKSLC